MSNAASASTQYLCTQKIDDFENGPREEHFYVQLRDDKVYFWMVFSNDPSMSDLDARLQDKVVEDVGIGAITGTDQNGWSQVEGDDVLSPYERKTYGLLARQLLLSPEIVKGAAKGSLIEITHRHDGRSKDPKKELPPSRDKMKCEAVN
jgi:hypothetical protein